MRSYPYRVTEVPVQRMRVRLEPVREIRQVRMSTEREPIATREGEEGEIKVPRNSF